MLLDHHLAELRRSGLTDETIRTAGIYSELASCNLAAILDWKKYPSKCCPAIVFPFTGPNGRNGYCRVKPDRPRLSGGKPVKYESPRGQPNQVYLPPGVADVLADPTRELLITEGEKKSLCASQHGFSCIGLTGVFGWKERSRESLLAALERVVWKGRAGYIVFDSDIATKEDVQDAEARLAAHLMNRGAKVRVARIPEGQPGPDGKPSKMGLDDFIVVHGIGALRKLLDEAEEPTPPSAVNIKRAAKEADPGREADTFLGLAKADGVSRLRFWRGAFWYWTHNAYQELAVLKSARSWYSILTSVSSC